MKIGLDIALIAMKRLADLLIIITGDADIVPALKLARREGMQVGLDPLGRPIPSGSIAPGRSLRFAVLFMSLGLGVLAAGRRPRETVV